MAEKIIAEYGLETKEFKNKILEIVSAYDKAEKAARKANEETKKGNDENVDRLGRSVKLYKEQEGSINKLRASIQQLTAMRDKSNSPTLITKYNQLIDQQQQKLKSLTSVQKDVNDNMKNTGNSIKNVGAETNKLGGTFGSLKGMAGQFAGAVGIAFGVQEVLQFTKATIDAASNLEETFTKTQQLFGANTDQIVEWSKTTANSLGQSQQQALDAASTFAIFGRSAGLSGDDLVKFSTDFTGLASDLASFNNTTPEEAIQAIGAALRGEAEPMRRYGVLLDDASLKQSALKLGIISSTKEALTPQQKVLAAQAEIYRQTTAAQGDFARTSDGLANQQRILAANFANLQAEIGQALLPVMLDFVKTLNSLVKGDIPGMIDGLGKLNDKLNPLGLGIGGIVNAFENFADAFKLVTEGDFSGAIEKLGSAFLDLNGAINPLIGVLRYFKSELFGISTELSEAEQLEQRLEARQNTFNNAVLEGGEALEIFRKRAKEVLGATDEQFNKYVETQRKRLAQSQMNNEEDKKSISLFKQMQQELTALNDKITQQILTGGPVSQKDIDRANALEKKLKELPIVLKGIKEGIDGIVPEEPINIIIPEDIVTEASDIGKRASDAFGESWNKTVNDTLSAEEKRKAIFDEYNLIYAGQGEIRVKNFEDEIALRKNELDESLKDGIISYEAYYAAIAVLDEQLKNKQIESAQESIKNIGDIVNGIAQVVGQVQQFQRDQIAQTYAAEIAAIEGSTLSEEEKAKRIEALKKKQAQEEYDLQVKQFKVNKAIAIVQAIINTAAGIAAQFQAGPVGIALAAIAAAAGAAQIAVIAAQQPPPPAFASGTDFVQRGKNKAGVDTVPAYLNEGEAVIPTDKNKAYPGLAKAWIAGNLDDYIVRNFVAPKLIDMERKAEKRMADSFAASLKGDGFDDARLLMATSEGNMYLKVIAKEMKTKQKKRTAW